MMKKTNIFIAILPVFLICGQGFCQEKDDLIGRALDDMEEVTSSVSVNGTDSFEEEGKPVLALEEEEPYIALLEFRETDIMTALNILQDKVGAVIVPDALISGTVTIQLKSIGLNDALRVMLEPNGLAFTESNGVYRVMTAEDYEKEKGYSFIQGVRTRVVALDYAEFPDVIARLEAIKSDSGRIYRSNRPRAVILIDHERVLDEMEEAILDMDVEIETEIFTLKNASAREVADKIKNELSKNLGQIRADADANKIVVTDTSASIEKIAALVSKMDVLRELELKAQVVQIVLNDEHKVGVDWEAIVSEYYALSEDADHQQDREKRELCLGTITYEDHEVLMEALEMVGQMRTFTMPPSMINDRQEASVGLRIGEEDVTLLVSSPPEYSFEEEKKEIPDAIFHLSPRIYLDNTLALAVTPVLAMRKRTAELKLQSDQVIVIGGIFKEEMVSRIKKFPILGSIPLLGIMFRARASDVVRIEHVIFLFPKVKTAVSK